MKAFLEFTLPDEEMEYYLSVNGHKFKDVIESFNNWLTSLTKHGDISEEQYRIYEECRAKLWEKYNEEII